MGRFGFGFGAQRRGVLGPAFPQSVDLTLYGADATLTDERSIDGFYLFANGASAVNRTVASAVSMTGDLLAEFVYPGNVMGYTSPNFHASSITSPTASFADATQREGLLTEGGGGGNTWVAAVKSGGLLDAGSVRNGNMYIELVGTAFIISTGATYATRLPLGAAKTRVDAAARFFAMTDLSGASALSKSVRIRVRAHPGG